MKEKRQLKQLTIRATDPEEFDRLVNEILSEHSDVKIEREQSTPMMAYLTFTETVEEAENLRESYLLAGCSLTCKDCPMIRISNDQRRKRHFCPEKQATVRLSMYCCETFFEKVEAGEIIIERKPELEVA